MSITSRFLSMNLNGWNRALFFYSICLSFFLQVHAQGPGNVTGNLRGWYRADAGITITGGAVSAWNDQSGLNNHGAQATGALRPLQTTAAINYNTAITFDGNDDYLNIPDLMATGTTAMSAFVVA